MSAYEEATRNANDAVKDLHDFVVDEIEKIGKYLEDPETYTRSDIIGFIDAFLYKLG